MRFGTGIPPPAFTPGRLTEFPRRGRAAVDVPALACSAALPVLLLNPERVPAVASFSSASVRVSDLVLVAAVAVAGTVAAGRGELRRAVPWLWLSPFLALLFVSAALSDGQTDAVSGAGKMAEWALYGVAVTLSARTDADLRLLNIALAGSALVFGSIGVLEVIRDGGRADAFVGSNALGLLGAVAVAMAVAGWALGFGVALRALLAAGGLMCLLSSASLGGALAVAVTAVVVVGAAVTRATPRARWGFAAAGAVTVLALVSIVVLRFDDISAAQGGAAGTPAQVAVTGEVGGSVAQRAMYADFGARMWLDNPLFGVGFQRSSEPASYLPVLPDVRADFPDLRADYFPPAPGTPYASMETAAFGLHSVYVQVPAELGLGGALLLVLGLGGLVRGGKSPSPGVGERALLLPGVAVLTGFVDHAFYGGVPDATLLVWALGLAAARGNLGALAPRAA